MDSKTFISALSHDLGISSKEVAELTEALADSIAAIAVELDSAAIPGFGTFHSEKTDEHIVTTPEGKRMLLPPAITLHFQPSVVLRKKIDQATGK